MSKGHILIVEDNDLNRKLERDVLQHNGYATLEAETAEEAMRLARKSCGAYSHGHLASRAQRNRGVGSVADRTRHARYPGDRGYRLVALDTPGSVLVRPALLAQSAKIREGGVALRFRRRVEQMSAPAKIQVVDDQPQNARRPSLRRRPARRNPDHRAGRFHAGGSSRIGAKRLPPAQRSAPPGTGVSSALDKERSAVLNDGPTTAWVAE
jgi:hypothetical protein